MIAAEQIPEAVAHAAETAWSKDATWKEIVAAAMNAWPVNSAMWEEVQRDDGSYSTIILPIQEPIMTPLGADFEKVWDDNAAQLYED